MKKIAVITASLGSLDLYNPTDFLDTVDYHAFVSKDKVGVKDNWIRHEAPIFSVIDDFEKRRTAKFPKVLPQLVLPGYEYYIWIDCTNKLSVEPDILIKKYLKDTDIACFKHQLNNCAYAEIQTCSRAGVEYPELLSKTKQFLESEKFPKNKGLTENTCRIQRNTAQMTTMGLMWWELICKYSSRDQLTLPYVIWKLGIKVAIMPGHAQGKNPYMPLWKLGNHKRKV